MNGAGLGSKYLLDAGKTVQTVTCSFCGSSCWRQGSIAPEPLSASPRCFEYHSRVCARFSDLKKMPPIPRMRPRCTVPAGGFDCGGCSPFEQIEMSSREARAMVREGI